MKNLVGHDIGSYIFSASAKTITFLGLPTITLDQVLLITNVLDGIIIYNFASSSLGGVLVGSVLTLDYDTTSMSDSDPLQIYIDLPVDITVQAAANEAQTHILLQQIRDLLKPSATKDNAGRQKIVIDAITGSLTLGTVSTITNAVPIGNIATFAGIDLRILFKLQAKTAYSTSVRNHLTFS
jgi:hypothetical protein